MEWAQVRALAADGISQREIAARLGINRRTVARLAVASKPPGYERAATGSMLDPLEPVIRALIAEWPEIKAPRVTEELRDEHGYCGSVGPSQSASLGSWTSGSPTSDSPRSGWQACPLDYPCVVARNESGPRYVRHHHARALRREGFFSRTRSLSMNKHVRPLLPCARRSSWSPR
jgi:Homeodomain-like domain